MAGSSAKPLPDPPKTLCSRLERRRLDAEGPPSGGKSLLTQRGFGRAYAYTADADRWAGFTETQGTWIQAAEVRASGSQRFGASVAIGIRCTAELRVFPATVVTYADGANDWTEQVDFACAFGRLRILGLNTRGPRDMCAR